jgi:snRNA-activating protein complex (SNAPc), subunit 3
MPGMFSCCATRSVVDDLLHPSSKLVAHISEPLSIGSKMNETPFSSLSLRINYPYWLVHHGNCEHFLVVDQIRYVFSLHNTGHLVEIFCLGYCIYTTLPRGTRLPRKLRLHYWGTVAHVQKSRPCTRLLVMCALVRVHAFYAHLVGGAWARQRTKRVNLLWLSHSQSMNLGDTYITALLLPLPMAQCTIGCFCSTAELALCSKNSFVGRSKKYKQVYRHPEICQRMDKSKNETTRIMVLPLLAPHE